MAERMSDAEALMWTMEKDPSLRSDFLNITLLDRSPDWDRLMVKIEQAVELLPRLRQRVVSAPLRLAPPQWVDDPQFDLGYHVRRVAVPEPGTLRRLLDVAAGVAAAPFDRARPLWEFTVVEGLEGDRAALLQKLHHTITDGVGGLRLSLAILDLERDATSEASPDAAAPEAAAPDADRAPRRPDTPLRVLTGALAHAARRSVADGQRAADAVGRLARHPSSIPGAAARSVRIARSLREQVLVTGEALSPVMTDRSLARRFEAFSVPLDGLKRAATATGASINDVFVAGVAGGLGRYHERMGAPVEELRMAMPVNLRESGDGSSGNRFAPLRMVVPVQPKDAGALVGAVSERLGGARSEPALGLAESVAGFVGLLPTSLIVPVARAQTRTIDFATSNLRGSPVELFLAGARIEDNHPMGPCTGCALNVTCLSYGGDLDMGINLDVAAVTDGAGLMECLDEAFASVLELGSH